ncbi:MAG: condensation domain-containing protein, partial [Planctomycetota bacterium]
MTDEARVDRYSVRKRIAALPPERRKLLEGLLKDRHAGKDPAPILPRPSDLVNIPLSYAQQRLWFLDQLVPGNTAYHLASIIPLRGTIDVPVLQRSLNQIVQRHEALRTSFGVRDGNPFQKISPDLILDLPIADLTRVPPKKRKDEIDRLVKEVALKPFDLSSGPLLRTMLIHRNWNDYHFLLTMHHIVADGWSMPIFFSELTALYRAFANGQPSPLPELPI